MGVGWKLGFWVLLLGLLSIAGACSKPAPAPKEAQDELRPPPPRPPKDALGNPFVGGELFERKCASCHEDRDEIIARDELLLEVVREGRGTMPAFGARLTQQQIEDIAAFVKGHEGPPPELGR